MNIYLIMFVLISVAVFTRATGKMAKDTDSAWNPGENGYTEGSGLRVSRLVCSLSKLYKPET